MYQRPYLTATWLALVSVLGIIGQMVFVGPAALAALVLAIAPTGIGIIAYMRR